MSEEQQDIRGEIIGLHTQLQSIKQRISELQDICQHEDTDIIFHTDESGRSPGVRIICHNCKKIIGYPTQQQLEESGYTTNISK